MEQYCNAFNFNNYDLKKYYSEFSFYIVVTVLGCQSQTSRLQTQQQGRTLVTRHHEKSVKMGAARIL